MPEYIFGADAAGNAGYFDPSTGRFFGEQEVLPPIGTETWVSDEFGNLIDPGAPSGGYSPGLPGVYINPEDPFGVSDPYWQWDGVSPTPPNPYAPSLPLPTVPYLGQGSEVPYISPVDVVTAITGPIYTAISTALGRVAVRSVWDARVPRVTLGRIVL